MSNRILRRTSRFSLLSLLLCVSVLFSACSLFNKESKDAKDIEEAVENYFEELIDGTLAEEDYESEYAEDAPFAEVDFSDEAVIPLMHLVFERVEYEFGEVDGSEEEEEATCEVILTVPNIEEIMDSLDEDYSLEDLEDALTDKKAPTEEYEIELELEYDDEWIIIDTSEIAEILAEPFADISFGPNVELAKATFDDYLKALAEGDVDTVNRIGDYYNSDVMYDYEETPTSSKLAYFSSITITFDDEAELFGEFAYLSATMTAPDTQAILNGIASDSVYMTSIMKPALLNYLSSYDYYMLEEEVLASLRDQMTEFLSDPEYLVETSVEIDMYFNPDDNQWLVNWVPYEFYEIASTTDEMYSSMEATIQLASDELLAEGSIDQAQYDELLYDLLGISSPSDPGDNTELASLQASLDGVGFYSWDLQEYVDGFSAADTTQIATDIYFYDDFTGTSLSYELYFNDALIDFQTVAVDGYDDGSSSAIFDFPMTSGSWIFEPGTYKAIIYTSSGEIITEASVEMI